MAIRVQRPVTAFPLSSKGRRRPRIRDDRYLEFLRELPCIVDPNYRGRCEAAHVRYGSLAHGKRETGAGEKPDDRWAVPLSPAMHNHGPDSQHARGERAWWEARRIDPLCVAALLYSAFKAGDEEGAKLICAWAQDISLWGAS